jgi:hypothetical protein
VAAVLAPASAAYATDVRLDELHALAREAVDSTQARDELRRVTSVDGQPADIGGALKDIDGQPLLERLQALQRIEEAPRGRVGDPAGQARDILEEERFHGGETPGPFKGFVDWLRGLVPDGDLPGSPPIWIVLGVLLFASGYLLARRLLNRRIALSEAAAEALAPAADDPKTLDRRAAEAEARGDLEAALRLRFRAGLLRLDQRGAIAFRPSISTHEVRRALHSNAFDALASTFDDVVYGGREPHTEDVAEARERWPEVVSSARERR